MTNEAQKVNEKISLNRTLTLTQPVRMGDGSEKTTVTAHRVLVKDYKQAAELYPNNGALQQIHVIAAACGMMVEDFESVCWEDYSQLSTFCIGSN